MSKRPLPTSNHQADRDDAEADPPAYSGPTTSTTTTTSPQTPCIPGLPNLDFHKYQLPESILSDDQVTTTTYAPILSSDPNALTKFLHEQAALPPRPQIHIQGSHDEYGSQKTDFDVRLNMIRYIIPESNKWHYLKFVGDHQMAFRGGAAKSTTPPTKNGVAEWTHRFCRESSALKTFTLEREVINWNTKYIDGLIRTMIATTKYRGHVTVTFPVTHSKVVVHSPHTINRFTTTILSSFMATKKFEVLSAIWPYATLAPNARDGDAPRSWAVQSEDAWWDDWKGVVKCAVLARHHGWVSLDHLMDFAMAPKGDSSNGNDWGVDK